MAEATEEVEEEEEQECPKCPPPGAPAWMATFADMATLLMAFFVLILSFAEFNVPKFKQISGSLKNAFGVQRIVPVVEQPKGTTVLSLNFSPSPSPSVTKQMTQQTTTIEQPELEQKQKEKDSDGGETDKKETDGGQLETDELAKALKEAIGRGDVTIESLGDKVFVNFNNTTEDDNKKDTAELIEETLKALEEARAASGKAEQEVLFGGIEQKLAELAASAKNNDDDNKKSNSDGEGSGSGSAEDKKAKIAEDNLQVALKQEIDKGKLGKIISVHANFWLYKPDKYYNEKWRTQKGAGPLGINLVHDIYLLSFLLGPIASVQAFKSNNYRKFDVEDSAVIILKFKSGTLGTINISDCIVSPWSYELTAGENQAYPETNESAYFIGGTDGSLQLPNTKFWFNKGTKSWWKPIYTKQIPTRKNHPLINQIEHFSKIIQKKEKPIVSGEDGLNSLKIFDAINKSSDSGKRIDIA